MGSNHGDRNDERFRRDQQSWSPYERDDRGERERMRDRERGGWESMDAARGDRGEIDQRYRNREGWRDESNDRGGRMASDRYGGGGDRDRMIGDRDRIGYGHGFDRYGGGGGYASERFEGPSGERDRYGGGDQQRYRGEGGQSGAQSGNPRGQMERTGVRGAESPQRAGGHRGKGPAGYQRSDERIREEISDLLTDDDDLDATHIEIQVKSCEVTLTGHVPDRRSKRLAEDLVERVAGVKDVTNNLKVQPDQQQVAGHGNGNGSLGRTPAQSVTSSTDKDTDQSHRRPRA